MSKKHFQMFADEIVSQYYLNEKEMGQEKAALIHANSIKLVKKVAIQANSRFNFSKFELACLVNKRF